MTLVQNFGIIYQDEFQTMGITAAQKSLLLHLHSAILCVMGLFTSPLLKKYSFRSIALIGASLMCFGIFCSSFAKSYETLILCISVCIGEYIIWFVRNVCSLIRLDLETIEICVII